MPPAYSVTSMPTTRSTEHAAGLACEIVAEEANKPYVDPGLAAAGPPPGGGVAGHGGHVADGGGGGGDHRLQAQRPATGLPAGGVPGPSDMLAH